MAAAAIKPHELLPDCGQARLPGALYHEAANDVMRDHCLYGTTPHHPDQGLVIHVTNLHHDVTLLGTWFEVTIINHCCLLHLPLHAKATIIGLSLAAVALDLQTLETVVVTHVIVKAEKRKRDPEYTGIALLR